MSPREAYDVQCGFCTSLHQGPGLVQAAKRRRSHRNAVPLLPQAGRYRHPLAYPLEWLVSTLSQSHDFTDSAGNARAGHFCGPTAMHNLPPGVCSLPQTHVKDLLIISVYDEYDPLNSMMKCTQLPNRYMPGAVTQVSIYSDFRLVQSGVAGW